MTSGTGNLTLDSLPYLPHSVQKVLDEAEHLAACGLPIKFDALPSVSDLESGVRACAAKLGDIEENFAKRCYAKLVTTFAGDTKQGEKEMRLRFAAFFDACKDLPPDLWEKATTYCTQELKWMPKPAEFREQVKAEFDMRRVRLRRAKDMLTAARNAPPVVVVHETRDERELGMIASYTRHGRYADANRISEQRAKRLGIPAVLIPDPSVAMEGMPEKAPVAPRKPPIVTDVVPDWTAEEVPASAYHEVEA